MQYLLRSYATNFAIQSAILPLRYTCQKPGELHTNYSVRVSNAFHGCVNVYPASERCTMLIDGLDPTIKTLVGRHQKHRPQLTYLGLVQYSRAEGDALCARNP